MSTVNPSTRVRPLRADVREQIVAAASAEFAERGYGGTSVAQVAARAGYTKGAVYSNFGGKPELFAAAMHAYFTGAVVDVLAEALGAAASAPDLAPTRAIARALADDVVRVQRWPALLGEFRSVVAEEPALQSLYTELRTTQRAELVAALRRAGEQVPLRPDLDLEVAATLLLTCVHGLAVEHAAAAEVMPTPLVEGLFTHVLEGILA